MLYSLSASINILADRNTLSAFAETIWEEIITLFK